MQQDIDARRAAREAVRECIQQLTSRMNGLCATFFTHLFRIDPSQVNIFDGSAVTLNRKFINMMATLKSIKDLEKMRPAIESLTKRHFSYGMRVEHLEPFHQALMIALKEQMGDRFTDELEQAWNSVYAEIIAIMKEAANSHPEWYEVEAQQDDPHHDLELFYDIGGEETVRRVHQRLYNTLFDHPWLGKFFYGKNKDALIHKQTNFMVACFGGPSNYVGEPPALAHMHMLVTEEMALEREKILRKSILDEGLGDKIAVRWLKIDRSFWPSINKTSVDECVVKCFGQAPLVVKKPEGYVTRSE